MEHGDDSLVDGSYYADVSKELERKADRAMAYSDTIVLVGDGIKVYIENKGLTLHSGRTHVPQEESVTRLYAGAHRIRQLVILSDKGYITLDAIKWCSKQGVNVMILDRDSNIVMQSCSHYIDAALRRVQYTSDKQVPIAAYLVKQKVLAQIDTLKKLPERPSDGMTTAEYVGKRIVLKDGNGRMLIESTWRLLEDILEELSHKKKIITIQALEGRIANLYWEAFIGMPIKWDNRSVNKVPTHWKDVTERVSSLSSGIVARHAINPFQSVLNYAYGILEAQVLSAINAVGLDPSCGCLHLDKVGRNSLVYDLMEPHRAQVDYLVFSLFEKTTFTRGMFILLDSGEVRLNPQFARLVAATCMLAQDTIAATVNSILEIYRLPSTI